MTVLGHPRHAEMIVLIKVCFKFRENLHLQLDYKKDTHDLTYKSVIKKLKANRYSLNAPHILILSIDMELFVARMVRTIIGQIVYTKNIENQCFWRDKKVDSGPLELKGKKSSSKIMLVNTYP